jgi:hypothetical protein
MDIKVDRGIFYNHFISGFGDRGWPRKKLKKNKGIFGKLT